MINVRHFQIEYLFVSIILKAMSAVSVFEKLDLCGTSSSFFIPK